MPVTSDDLKAAVRAAIQVTHMDVEDKSNGCGNSYFVLIVSKVVNQTLITAYSTDQLTLNYDMLYFFVQEFEGKTTLARHRMGIIYLSSVVVCVPPLLMLFNLYSKRSAQGATP
jgi:stress-induced morphogen